jgi:hypothetical protein
LFVQATACAFRFLRQPSRPKPPRCNVVAKVGGNSEGAGRIDSVGMRLGTYHPTHLRYLLNLGAHKALAYAHSMVLELKADLEGSDHPLYLLVKNSARKTIFRIAIE